MVIGPAMQIDSNSCVPSSTSLFDACRAFGSADDLLRDMEVLADNNKPSDILFDAAEEPRLIALAQLTLIEATSDDGVRAKAEALGRLLETGLREPSWRIEALIRSLTTDIMHLAEQSSFLSDIEVPLDADSGRKLVCCP